MLEKELEYFKAHREEFLGEYKDKFVLIKDTSLIGAFDTEEEAYNEGIRQFGNVAFLIKKVSADEETVYLPALLLGLTDARI